MNYFDHYAALNNLSPEGRRQYWRGYRVHFAPLLPRQKDSRILDLGCGAGLLLEWLGAMGFTNTVGIDVDPGQAAFARSIGQNAVVVEDPVAWLERQEPFGAVFMSDVLEHLPEDQIQPLLGAIRASLEKAGSLIVRVPNATSVTSLWMRYMDVTHKRLYTSESLRFVLHEGGFENVRILQAETWRPRSLRDAILIGGRAMVRAAMRVALVSELARPGLGIPLCQNLLAVASVTDNGAQLS
jgi:SAM-dependent methyltransferase